MSHQWNQTVKSVRKCPIRVKIDDFDNWRMSLKKYRTLLLCCFKLCASFYNHQWNQTGVTVQKRPIQVKIDDCLTDDLVHLLCYFKLCASFHSHQWNQTWVTVQKRPIQVKIDDFLSSVTLKFDRWPWKTIDLDIWQMTLKNNRTPLPCCCDVWPWYLMDDLEKQ